LWYIRGDFTATRFPSERSRVVRFSLAIMQFSDFISEKGLMNLPLVGESFTWSNNRESPSWSRINKFLVSLEWKPSSLIYLRKCCIDYICHFPILLDCDGIQRSKRSFKFEKMWIKADDFVDKVRQWWSSY
jgi:hypothetical protein